jgi:hypothetical protein
MRFGKTDPAMDRYVRLGFYAEMGNRERSVKEGAMRTMREMAHPSLSIAIVVVFCAMASSAVMGQTSIYDCTGLGGAYWEADGLRHGRPAIFRPSNGLWMVQGYTRFYFGGRPNDIPLFFHSGEPMYYSCQPGIYRKSDSSTGYSAWLLRNTSVFWFGYNTDIPVPGNYTYDIFLDDDMATFGAYPSLVPGYWEVRERTHFTLGAAYWWPVHGYWDPNNTETVPAVWNPGNGQWVIKGLSRFNFGTNGDLPVPGCYSGSVFQAAIFRPTTGMWSIRGFTRFYFGQNMDWPIAADLGRTTFQTKDSNDDPVLFRPSSGMWRIRGAFYGGGNRTNFGVYGDIPIAGPMRSDI